MKQLATSYTFNAAARTITFTGTVPASLESILSVTNATTGTLLFLPQGGAALTGTWASPVLTLAASTTGMANGDRLQILFEDGVTTTPVSDGGGSLTVDGPLTDTQLRASAVPVSGALTDAQLRATAVPISGALTDAQLRATAVPISDGGGSVTVDGPITDTQLRASAVPVSGPLTNAQLRAADVPVSDGGGSLTVDGTVTANAGTNLNTSALALEAGGNLAGVNAKLPALDSGRIPVVLPPGGSGLTDAELRATAVPVSASALPLPTGAATETTLATVNGKLPALDSGRLPVVLPPGDGGLTNTELRAAPVPTSFTPPPFVRVGFAEVGSGMIGKAAEEFTLLQTGSGMAVSQSAGNLVVTTGTTTNSETVIRSIRTFSGSMLARVKVILSQRIVNQTFRFELADLVGDGLSFTINSATSITVTFPTTNPFTAANVGQSLRVSRVSGAAGIPGRYAIASISGLTVNLTVAGWPASGSGTLSLYGWNSIWTEYTGTTATNSTFDAARRGWASGNTTATINTTASPGHVAQLAFDVFTAGLGDALVASNTGYQWANRASRIESIPDPDVSLHLFIVVQNGSVAPASTTTLTVGFIQVEDQGRQKIRIASSDPVGSHALPVQVLNNLTPATETGNLATVVSRLPALISAMIPVLARGSAYFPSVTFTRTADTNAYLAGDVIGINAAGSPGSAIHTFTAIGPSAGNVQLTTASITINLTSVPSGMAGFVLHLYTASPTAILDNAAFSSAAADRALYVGSITFPTPTVVGGGYLHVASDYIGRQIKLTTANLFGVLQTLGAYTPASATEFILRLNSGEVGL